MSRILRYWELKDRGVPWSREHIRKLEKAGVFPQRVKLSERVIGWVDTEIDAWWMGGLTRAGIRQPLTRRR